MIKHSFILFEGDGYERGLVSDECIETEHRGSCDYHTWMRNKPARRAQRLTRFQQEKIEKYDTDMILYF